MALTARGGNRGPAAAADNRRALLRAARDLFADKGYNVPLSAIAREAGVGQGVLYRHFPRRLDLAFAVFEENFAELEALSARTDPDVFERFFERIVELMVESVGFVELVVGARGVVEEYDGDERLARLLTTPLARGQEAGRVASRVTVDDVGLALRMIYGVAATARGDAGRRADVERVRDLVLSRWRI
ncbi:transcriptional regulator, TetR family [Georgenia satyanarayanai]|uniref:Transcriptional regulator, TetR family n=1 Tax=Georgenia satyanarayanai TaxID=860221 RepID=A0A2Y9AM86_9MICO|nr:TetR/AcrR family transcriptional regulator [Georgenia satyanarayanai]PYF97896.1 TetR family transcriptional regulator [Georgenia satyanarayanai]SSA45470.1 transcriptional regulator, TetR family [Georgenia satyanarayanai]